MLNLAEKANTFKILGVRILKHDKVQVVIFNDSLDDVTADGPRIDSIIIMVVLTFRSIIYL